jgi:hypothetical protein
MEENVRQEACQFRLITSSSPDLCSEYHTNYFRAFVLHADRNNMKSACHDPEMTR